MFTSPAALSAAVGSYVAAAEVGFKILPLPVVPHNKPGAPFTEPLRFMVVTLAHSSCAVPGLTVGLGTIVTVTESF